MIFEETIEVAAPADRVHAYVGDFENLPAWDPGISAVRKVSPGPIGVGTRYEVSLRFLGVPATMDYAVVEHSPPARSVLRGTANGTVATDTIETTPTAGGCRVRWRAEIRLPWPMSWADGVVAWLFSSSVEAALEGLRRELVRLSGAPEPAEKTPATDVTFAVNGAAGHP